MRKERIPMRRGLLHIALGVLVCVAAGEAAQQTPPVDSAGASAVQASVAARPSLDYEVFKAQVQPIFLKKRPGHARCYACHALGAGEGGPMNVLRLQVLSPGSDSWDEEQSRKNFETILTKVVPGNLRASRLLMHPLRY